MSFVLVKFLRQKNSQRKFKMMQFQQHLQLQELHDLKVV